MLECFLVFFFFNDPATTEIYTLSLHDALPIYPGLRRPGVLRRRRHGDADRGWCRSEEHTSELQSRGHLVCRLLLEKKKYIYDLPVELQHRNARLMEIGQGPSDVPSLLIARALV